MTAVLDSPVVVDGGGADGATPAAAVNTMKATALFTALTDALLFAAPAAMMRPPLEAVRLEFSCRQLIAVATDSVVLGASRVDYAGEPFVVMVAGSDAKALAKMAKTAKRDAKWREVSIEVVDAGAQVTFRFNSGESMVVRGLDVDFPKWRHLIPSDAARMGGIVGMGYDPSRLAKFCKVRPDEHGASARMVAFPSVTATGKPGATTIRIGEDFVGLLMPIRPAGDEWEYEWPGWLGEDASVAANTVSEATR